jgi:hypothetical protein
VISDAPHTARLPLPDFLVQGDDNVLTCPIYRTGVLVAPASATVSVFDASNTAIVDSESATITGSVATYEVAGAVTASLSRSMGWRVEWVITLDDGTVLRPRNDAALVRSLLQPVVTDSDLVRRVPALDPTSPRRIAGPDGYQPFLDEAWVEIVQRLISQGSFPHRVLNPSALRPVHMYLTLSLIFEDAANRLQAAFQERADYYREQYRAAFDALTLVYDTDDDGAADQRSRPAASTIWLTGR